MTRPIPDKALAQHIAVLGKTGSGKSYAIRGVVEQLLDEEARCCVIDPTGIWWGLKSSATGKSGGYPVVIFGGTHADLPLGAAHGEALAEAIGTSSTPAIVDTSQMKVGERTRFFADFADALVRKNKGPLHLVIDEAHLFAPQGKVNDPQSGAMLHAANNLVSLGRSRGLRIVLITQRPAKLHKDSLTQVETLVAMRLIAPQDRKAVEEWIKDNADQDKGREIISSLATLKTGQAWVWAPELGVLERVQFPKIRTFDSSAAPDDSDAGAGPVLAPIDREAIAARLKAVAIEADANDPKKLRAKIAELERTVRALHTRPDDPIRIDAKPAQIEAAEERGYRRGYREGANHGLEKGAQMVHNRVLKALNSVRHGTGTMAVPYAPSEPLPWPPPAPRMTATEVLQRQTPPRIVPKASHARAAGNGAGEKLPRAERSLLTVLAQHQSAGRTRSQLAVLSGYSGNSSTFANALGALRSSGYVNKGEPIRITDAGEKALGAWDPLPSGQELIRHWMTNLGKAERTMLEIVTQRYPAALSKEELGEASGYSTNSSTFANALGRLRSLELVERGAEIRACEELFA